MNKLKYIINRGRETTLILEVDMVNILGLKLKPVA